MIWSNSSGTILVVLDPQPGAAGPGGKRGLPVIGVVSGDRFIPVPGAGDGGIDVF